MSRKVHDPSAKSLTAAREILDVIDQRELSVQHAGAFLELCIQQITSGKAPNILVARVLAEILWNAASHAKNGDKNEAETALLRGVGFQAGNRRKKYTTRQIFSAIGYPEYKDLDTMNRKEIIDKLLIERDTNGNIDIDETNFEDRLDAYENERNKIIELSVNLIKPEK